MQCAKQSDIERILPHLPHHHRNNHLPHLPLPLRLPPLPLRLPPLPHRPHPLLNRKASPRSATRLPRYSWYGRERSPRRCRDGFRAYLYEDVYRLAGGDESVGVYEDAV